MHPGINEEHNYKKPGLRRAETSWVLAATQRLIPVKQNDRRGIVTGGDIKTRIAQKHKSISSKSSINFLNILLWKQNTCFLNPALNQIQKLKFCMQMNLLIEDKLSWSWHDYFKIKLWSKVDLDFENQYISWKYSCLNNFFKKA